jgi:hypothetical protein
MSTNPNEPTNLVLEQLRLMSADMSSMRAEMTSMRAETNSRFDRVEAQVAGIKVEVRGLKLNAIAEIYKANLTVASFADHERRIQELERKSS